MRVAGDAVQGAVELRERHSGRGGVREVVEARGELLAVLAVRQVELHEGVAVRLQRLLQARGALHVQHV
uniref:Uncharacterized protein n=1 Tax=Spironucleus salmonicida TaxID=348837 RepID=V6LP26_9EUKA|eukprot:EST45471.1 Hypothetical protein SS50377_14625 [Spironucleus salmonicida]